MVNPKVSIIIPCREINGYARESIAKKENPYRLIEEVRQHCANHD